MNDNDSTRLRHHLQALPEAELPGALWLRVDGARRRQLARRRLGVGAGTAALLALAVLPLWFNLQPQGTPPDARDMPVASVGKTAVPPQPSSRSAPAQAAPPAITSPADEALAAADTATADIAAPATDTREAGAKPLAQSPPPAQASPQLADTGAEHARQDARLRALDRNLQAAYRNGASDAEIAQLWQVRRALLDEDRRNVTLATIRI